VPDNSAGWCCHVNSVLTASRVDRLA
jgi:hypothetical protein